MRCLTVALSLIAGVSAISTMNGVASANSMSVQLACASDYYAYCSKHDPDGQAVRACMRVNGSRLSDRCFNALVAAGEVSKADVSRRASARK